jgi:ferredoxin
MEYRVSVDESLCSGYGSGVDTAPHLFELVDGRARVKAAVTDDSIVLDAQDACPMGAIEVDEG